MPSVGAISALWNIRGTATKMRVGMIQKTNKNFMRDLWDMGPFPSIPNWLHAWLSGIMIKESSKKPRGQLNSSCSQTAGRLVTGHYLFQRSFQGQFWNINDHKIPPSLIPPRSKVFLPKVPGLLHSFCYSKTYTCCHSFWKVFFFFFLNHPLLSSKGIWYKSDRVLGFWSSLQRPGNSLF